VSSSLRRGRHTLGYHALRCVLAGGRLLPLGALRWGGSTLGRLASRVVRLDRERALANLRQAFPERDDAYRHGVIRRCARHLGLTFGEIVWLWSASAEEVLHRSRFVGLESLTTRLGPRQGVVLVTGHCGNWEWMNLALGASGVPMSVAAREVYDPRLDGVAQRLRGRFGGETILRGDGAGQRLVQALHRGRVVGLLIDQDIDAPGAFVEFFGNAAWTPTGAATLALRTGTPVVAGFASRQEDGAMLIELKLVACPERTRHADEAAAQLTADLTAAIESQIRAHPEQWVWMHRRWKRRPSASDQVWRARPLPPG
jgi:Kdo2-lipid IVA lauroyltransferase/acyltransferase